MSCSDHSESRFRAPGGPEGHSRGWPVLGVCSGLWPLPPPHSQHCHGPSTILHEPHWFLGALGWAVKTLNFALPGSRRDLLLSSPAPCLLGCRGVQSGSPTHLAAPPGTHTGGSLIGLALSSKPCACPGGPPARDGPALGVWGLLPPTTPSPSSRGSQGKRSPPGARGDGPDSLLSQAERSLPVKHRSPSRRKAQDPWEVSQQGQLEACPSALPRLLAARL